ncbi:MAG: tripartite tricarboxylate transporter TctB family protein [Rhodobacteraceae bacterium]|nr:tripartite tricarboxylate transporter TctB family protein [Paracoccaceae bacterium]
MMRNDLALLVPLGLIGFALIWLGYAWTLPSEGMIGDRFGYDPGSRFLPVAAGVVLAAALLGDVVRRWPARPVSGLAGPVQTGPVLAHVAILILYLIAFRPLGFVLSTALVLFGLIALNQRHMGQPFRLWPFLGAVAAVVAGSVAVFSALRWVIRTCFALARTHGLPILREPAVQTGLATLIVVGTLGLMVWICRRWRHLPHVAAVQVAIGTTFAIYLMFRQLFLIQLPPGILNW